MTLRISNGTADVLTETDLTKYSVYGDSDNVLIKEHARGTGSVSFGNTGTVSHSLGYIPFYLAYTEIGSGTMRIANSYDPVGVGWRVYSSTAGLMFYNLEGTTVSNYKYYIFKDNMEGTL